MRYSLCLAAIVAAVTAIPAPVVSQISDGQVQAPTGVVTQISDGQIQAPTGVVTQISDGQIQAPTGVVTQISDGQIQAPKATGTPVQQISDGQVQKPASTSAPKYTSKSASKSASKASSSAAAYTPPSGYGSYNPAGGAAGPQVPFKFPLDNGFPNVKVPSANLTLIEKQAHGTLPNTALPKKLSDASATTFQVIAFNEIFEVAYFTSLLKNVSSGVFSTGPADKEFFMEAITAVQAQEQLHALGANAILASANRTTVLPCEYKFPVADFNTSVATASLFTDVVLGTLADVEDTFATTGDSDVVSLVGSIIAQEGEQDGYYRALGKKVPSALPFLTGGSGAFAFSALNQLFVVPGSCGNFEVFKGVPVFQPLTVVTPPKAADSNITFSYPIDPSIKDPSGLRLVYINQQNAPIVQELENLKVTGNTVTFTSPFPYTANLLNGLTIAAVTNNGTSFSSADEVAAATVWGPGLIEVN